jgi:hypothetical protein
MSRFSAPPTRFKERLREGNSHGTVNLAGERSSKPFPAKEAVPARDFISAKCKFTDICVFACPLAELVMPPTVRHQAETSSAMIAELWMSHRTLAHQSTGKGTAAQRKCRPLPMGRRWWRSVQLKRTHRRENGFIEGKKRFQSYFVATRGHLFFDEARWPAGSPTHAPIQNISALPQGPVGRFHGRLTVR